MEDMDPKGRHPEANNSETLTIKITTVFHVNTAATYIWSIILCLMVRTKKRAGLVQVLVLLPPVNREVTGSSGDLYTLHDVWERPPANNLPQTPHSAGVYGTGYVLFWW